MGNEALLDHTPRPADVAATRASPETGATMPPVRDTMRKPGSMAAGPPSPRSDAALIKRMQRSHGNRHVQRLLGDAAPLAMSNGLATKAHDGVGVARGDDPLEAEADRVAERVTTAGAAPVPCAACSAAGSTCPTCREIQRKAVAASAPAASMHVPAFGGGGQPLSGTIRGYFEPRIGADLGGVRVHTDRTAAEAAHAVGARAFTLGTDIAFARDQFAPETPDGQRLLAHELAHVMQQSDGGERRIARKKDPPASMPPDEPRMSYGPVGETMMFEGRLLAANEEYLEPILCKLIAEKGESEAGPFAWRLDRHVAEKIRKDVLDDDMDVDDPVGYVAADLKQHAARFPEAAIAVAVSATVTKILANNRKWLADFEAKAYEVVLGMLAESEERVNQERIRYGVDWWDEAYTEYYVTRNDTLHERQRKITMYSMQDTPGTRALAMAASGILTRKFKFDEAKQNMEDFGESNHADAIGELARQRYGVRDDPVLIRLNELRAVTNHAKRDLDVFREQKTAEFPILAAYASDEKIAVGDLNTLQMLAIGKNPFATDMIGKEIKSRLQHIAEVRTDILEHHGEETKIWRVPRIIEGTRAMTGALPGTMYGRLVDDKVKDEAPGIWTSILIGLLQLVLVLLAPATGGLTLIPAAAISVGQAYQHFREYERAQMLRGTDFGAMALSSEDPSLFWLAVDIIGAGFDVGAAVGAAATVFRALAPAARAAQAARGAEAAKAIESLERTAAEVGGEALAKAVGRDARAASDATHVGATLEESKALERAGELLAAQELRSGAGSAESIAGRTVKVSESGAIFSCASPCTLLRERYRGMLQRSEKWEGRVKDLEAEASRIPKGKAGDEARQKLAERAAALEKEMRTNALKGDWTSPLQRSDPKLYNEMLERRGSFAAELDHHPPGWTGKDEARFRYGKDVHAEDGYRWKLDEDGALHYERMDRELPLRQYNAATDAFEEAAEGTLITSVKGPESARELATIPKKQRTAMEEAFKERGKFIKERDRLEALEEAGKTVDKDGQAIADKLKKLYSSINEESRQLGENAAEGVMRGRGGKKIYPVGKSVSKSGDFDQVWKVGDEFHIVEAKGGSSALGSRAIPGGMRAEQGTLQYAKSIAENMAKHGATKEIRELGEELLVAIGRRKIKYLLVRAPIGTEKGAAVLRDVKVSEFVLH